VTADDVPTAASPAPLVPDGPVAVPFGAPEPEPAPASLAQSRPEAAAGAAFAGGLLTALILKRLGRR
jgi:hypothetical protein